MHKFHKLVAALGLLFVNQIAAHPMEAAGGIETTTSNVPTTEAADCPGVPKRYYEDLNCTAWFKNPKDNCPSHYTCDDFERSDPEMCYFGGESLAPGTELNDTGNPCDIGCSCVLDGPYPEYNVSKMAVFRCAVVDCPLEEESPYDENGKLRNCVPKKSHDECCASETVCKDGSEDGGDNTTREIGDAKSAEGKNPDEQAPKKLATCTTADNKTYIEGEEFYPEDLPCKKCICQPGYTAGESGEPWCRELQCGSVIGHTREIREGCVPVYFNNRPCCPIEFRCPKESDSVISDVLVKIAPKPEETCKFGELFLRVGDRLANSPDAKCTECKCEVPPLLTCNMKPHC